MWIDDEPRLGAAGRAALRRLARRARASWPVWVAAAGVLTLALTLVRARTPAQYGVTVVLRVTEGPVSARGGLGAGALRVHLRELTFTNSRLLDLMRRHAEDFPGAARDPDGAL